MDMKTTKNITKNIVYVIVALLLVNVTACKKLSSYDYPPASGTAYDIIGADSRTADNNYTNFRYAVDKAGLDDLFTSGDYTYFVPTNLALNNAGYTIAVLQNMTAADAVVLVKSHIVAGRFDVKTISGSQQQTTLSGSKITVQKIGDLCYVNGGDILVPSQVVANGFFNPTTTCLASRNTLMDVITAISPATASSQFLLTAITRASTSGTNFTALLTGSTPYTFFAPTNAPTNAAFTDAGLGSVALINAANATTLADMLKYQLVAGAKLTTNFDSIPVTAYNGTPLYFDKIPRKVNGYTTPLTNFTSWFANGILFGNNIASNLTATNGVIHTVNRFFPAPITTNTLATINADPTLTMFYALIQRASTADPNYNFAVWLADPTKSYTVFAVNNTGLQAAGYASIAAINAADPIVLAQTLKLHIIAKRLNNISVAEGGSVNTLLPDPANYTSGGYAQLRVTTSGGFKIQGASNSAGITVTKPNTVTTNGILNIIGSILLP